MSRFVRPKIAASRWERCLDVVCRLRRPVRLALLGSLGASVLMGLPLIFSVRQSPSPLGAQDDPTVAFAAGGAGGNSLECAIQVLPTAGSLDLAFKEWARLWGAYMCAFETLKSGITQVTSWWNKNADNINTSLASINATKDAVQSLKSIELRLEEQESQLREIVSTLIVRNPDWTKTRLNKIRPETLILLRDMESFNRKAEGLMREYAGHKNLDYEKWSNSPEGVSFQNALKARNDIMLEKGKASALQEELSVAERAANAAAKTPAKERVDPMEVYGRLTRPTEHKILLAQYEAQILQLEILLKLYERQALERPLDKDPMGGTSAQYFAKRLSELKATGAGGVR